MDSAVLTEILKIVVMVIGVLLTYVIVPYIKKKFTNEQLTEAKYWTKLAVVIAEKIYEEKGSGQLKKENVINYLKKMNINLTTEQFDLLVDGVVEELKKAGLLLG